MTNDYDNDERLISSTDAAGTVTTNQYDSLGNLTYTQMGYYSNGNFIALSSMGNNYDANGSRIATTNALNIETRLGYDAQNRVTVVTNAYGTPDQTVSQTIYDPA